MSDLRWDRMWNLFHRALELAADERAAFLDAECAGDAPLRDEVAHLLSVEGRPSGILERHEALTDADTELLLDPLIGSRIGPYRIEKIIGEGGMGVVYEAEQETPVRRRVALKVIRVGMDTERVVARFDAERQALALMNHPRIARVFDAGASDEGRPYFVMELVEGVPITTYCDSQRLGTVARLELFLQVCDGFRHAHQKGVIHRDIKPSNLLVADENGQASPKIIDFGIAKATEQRLTEQTVFTSLGEWVGTPEYMSPEQAGASGDDIDTRTDVYSLGVLLYELLVGALPFDSTTLREAGFDELRRKIREDEPSKPSTRIDTLDQQSSTAAAARRRTDVAGLRSELSGDLDWITMKALEKDRDRRYESVAQFGEDIARHMRHEPVIAGPPSAGYRARKFVRRHTVGVAFAGLAVSFLAVVFVVMTVQAGRIAAQRDRANREAEVKGRVSDFMKDLFTVSDPSEARGNSITARELLDRGVETIRTELVDEPEVQAEMMATMGVVYDNLGLHGDAELLLQDALDRRRSTLGPDNPSTLESMSHLASNYWRQGRYAEAERIDLEVLAARRSSFGPDHIVTLKTMSDLANVYRWRGRFDDAEPLAADTLAAQRRLLGNDHQDTMTSMNNLAGIYNKQGRHDEAITLFLESVDTQRRVLGDDHPNTLASIANLAAVYSSLDRYTEAEPFYLETLETQKRVLGTDHSSTAGTMHNIANMYRRQGRTEEAAELFGETLEIVRRVLGHDHPRTLFTTNALGVLFLNEGRLDEAEPFLLETLDARRRVIGVDHPSTLLSAQNVAQLYRKQGRHAEAEPLFRSTLEAQRRALGENHVYVGITLLNLGGLYTDMARYDEARPNLEAAQRIIEARVGTAHAFTARVYDQWAVLLRATGDETEAERLEAQAEAIRSK